MLLPHWLDPLFLHWTKRCCLGKTNLAWKEYIVRCIIITTGWKLLEFEDSKSCSAIKEKSESNSMREIERNYKQKPVEI